ncbi:MAG: carboxypeptidase-like regulatory domain-containing protein [Candidatus Cybelea sp.]
MNVALCLALGLAALSPTPEITGTIVDYQGKPVAQTSISVVSLSSNDVISETLSNSNGSFSFAGLASGGYGLEAKTDSACAFSDAVQVDAGFTSVVRLRLVKGLCQNPISILRNHPVHPR